MGNDIPKVSYDVKINIGNKELSILIVVGSL